MRSKEDFDTEDPPINDFLCGEDYMKCIRKYITLKTPSYAIGAQVTGYVHR